MTRFMAPRDPTFKGGGKQRAKINRLFHAGKGLEVPKSQEKDKVGPFTTNKKGKQTGGHEVAHRGFMVKEHEKRVILYRSPGAGKGRGHGHHKKGYHLSAATRAKISAALKGRHHSHKGHPLSAATKAKISASLKRYDATHHAQVVARAKKAAATRKAKGEKPFAKKSGVKSATKK